MENDDGPSLVQDGEKCVEFRGAEVLSTNVCGEFDAVGFQRVEGIDGPDGRTVGRTDMG